MLPTGKVDQDRIEKSPQNVRLLLRFEGFSPAFSSIKLFVIRAALKKYEDLNDLRAMSLTNFCPFSKLLKVSTEIILHCTLKKITTLNCSCVQFKNIYSIFFLMKLIKNF